MVGDDSWPVTNRKPYLVTFYVNVDDELDSFEVMVHPEWAPLGAARFRELLDAKFYRTDVRFFRVVPTFITQFGISGDPAVSAEWRGKTIRDDPVVKSNQRGYISFATTQMFVNTKDNKNLDGIAAGSATAYNAISSEKSLVCRLGMGFSPFAEVVGDGMGVVDRIFAEYGETPAQGRIQAEGNKYLKNSFPRLSYITDIKKGSEPKRAARRKAMHERKPTKPRPKATTSSLLSGLQKMTQQTPQFRKDADSDQRSTLVVGGFPGFRHAWRTSTAPLVY
ncbi:hypothetical protein EMIHUDRAFT_235740 [Emiliania huxleyi CCMP1516]|uniref:PPIase cyclophilin-type domain-containing protein n=2 Tax=Emiliania huxleyi TaxID=2903 RepID=A0A0D3JVH6_EMIH1|nr:hypothetical protein EMIHUDRAFT_235740 [Emiliania huxleyi CCMP1516]EOD27511.1 hypothetical protein EMIHUDRAFT_235740 [Emiliania huxleyi CCMP1516]|eukprot:XP_005779940.1 hypothetical protein EMIHUDRAFT_235740 [Emiliania huxleyi CCMP1516]